MIAPPTESVPETAAFAVAVRSPVTDNAPPNAVSPVDTVREPPIVVSPVISTSRSAVKSSFTVNFSFIVALPPTTNVDVVVTSRK